MIKLYAPCSTLYAFCHRSTAYRSPLTDNPITSFHYAPKEHNPPHVHAYYQDHISTIQIQNCEIIEGQIPSRQLRLIQAWIEIHREELLADWDLCQNGEKPFQIEPLK